MGNERNTLKKVSSKARIAMFDCPYPHVFPPHCKISSIIGVFYTPDI